ncbi:hypothetical protein DY000_02031179 [Brassica cretica]|uniref:Uncharacterized protein n=1 Tax=Brassica cretica TaxID=69181 RepID=A0ABQ7DHB5_BRACR|nr:hypothetical protein DY000_02031179 [Brassica cretica]
MPNPWFLRSKEGSDSFGTPSRSRRTWRKREPVSVMKVPELRTERWIIPPSVAVFDLSVLWPCEAM